MTICIGAICDRASKIVAVADRMLTAGDLTVAFEHEERKMTKLSPNCIALTAGSALAPTDLFRGVIAEIPQGATPPVVQVAEAVKNKYAAVRRKRIEDSHFHIRGFNMEWFYQNQGRLSEAVVLRLERAIEQYKLDIHTLVVGVDTSGGHIYQVYPPGVVECFDAVGYAAIGTGERHADSVFIAYRHTPQRPLREVLYYSYEAKKKAEIAVGVGQSTDIAIIGDSGVSFLPQETVRALDKIYKKKMEIQTERNEEVRRMIDGLVIPRGEEPSTS